MTDQKAAAVARLESCKANLDSEYPTCERCGLAWHRGGITPACKPMSVKALRLVLISEAAALEGSHNSVVKMREAGLPAAPADALQRATALRGVLLFVDRCSDSEVIIRELQSIARQAERDAAEDRKGEAADE